jgi:hypothetical protein
VLFRCEVMEMVCAWRLARPSVTWSTTSRTNHRANTKLGEESLTRMQCRPRPSQPPSNLTLIANGAAEFVSVDRKTIQRVSREGRIPAHPVLTGARRGRTTWRYKLSELDEWARTQQNSVAATRATSRRAIFSSC